MNWNQKGELVVAVKELDEPSSSVNIEKGALDFSSITKSRGFFKNLSKLVKQMDSRTNIFINWMGLFYSIDVLINLKWMETNKYKLSWSV